jgi:hypothetical protein
MYSITNNSRTVAVVVGVGLMLAVAFGGFAAPAHAQLNSAQVQAIISLLQSFGADAATIANVQAALTGGPVSGGAGVSCTFTRSLTIGATGADVTCLQRALIAGGFSIPAGATGYFGEQTRSAVAAWQASRGVSPAVGYFGPISQAAWNLNVPGPGPVTPPPSNNDDLEGGAGDINVTERSSGIEDEVLEGESDVEILGFEVEADGSDVRITSVRVELEHTGSGNDRLDRYVDEVCVFMGSQSVGCEDADEFSESSDVYSENLAVNAVVRDGDTERFYVAVSAVNNIDSDDIGEDWVVGVGTIRFEDATGAIITDATGDGVSGGDNGPLSETITFEDLSSAGDVELNVREDDEDVNDPRTVSVDDSSDTNDVEILSFTLEAEGSDMTVDNLSIEIDSSGAGVTEIANDFRLMMGSDEVGQAVIDRDCDGGDDGFSSNTDTAICVRITDLDDDDVMIDEGDEVAFTLVADINDLEGNFTGGDSFTSVSLSASDIEAEDQNGDEVTDLTGTATSEDISFFVEGLEIARGGSDSAGESDSNGDTAGGERGEYTIRFDVTAFGEDIYIPMGATLSTSSVDTNDGIAYAIENSDGEQLGSPTTNAAVSTTADTSGDFYVVREGQTESFTLTVSFTPGSDGFYRAQLHGVNFNAGSANDADTQQLATPQNDYQTDFVNLDA